MIETAEIIHYCTIVLMVIMTCAGVGIGQGLAGKSALQACDLQPSAQADIFKAAIFGGALIETSAIIGLTMALFLFFDPHTITSLHTGIAQLGIALALCLPGFVIGVVSSFPASEACLAIARQPFFQQKILRLMLLTQSIIQTPVIFGFIIAMFIKNQSFYAVTLVDSIRLAMSGLCIGLGSIGPAIGLGIFGRAACRGVGINRNAYGSLLSFTLVSEAIIETPIVFALVTSLLLISIGSSHWHPVVACSSMIGAALCMGIGTLGPGISSGRTAASACEQITQTPESYATISRLSMFCQGMIDTSSVYAFTIAILLIFAQ